MITKVNSWGKCKFSGCDVSIPMSVPKQTKYCDFHKNQTIRQRTQNSEIKGQYLKENKFIEDYYIDSNGFLICTNYLNTGLTVRGKEIEFSHIGEKIENENKGMGDQRGRNSPSDLIVKLIPEEFYSELDKTIPLVRSIHLLLDEGCSIEEIRKYSTAKDSIIEASIELIKNSIEV